jgi:hypothetical protein
MLGNDDWGDCAWAGAAHETMLLTKEAGHPATFTTASVLSDYSVATGFDPNAGPPDHNKTDRGTNVRAGLTYRRHTGIVDGQGQRHKIGAFVRLDTGNLEHIYQAMYLFQIVGIGISPFPDSAMEQFHAGEPWDVVPGSPAKDGHYVCCIAKRQSIEVVSWGALQQMTEAFFEKYCDEAWTYVSSENLRAGVDPEGFKLRELRADLKALSA